VIGAGMIALLLLQPAQAAGCSPVFVPDVNATRLQLAKKLGANEVIEA
jgi:L-iditol 2-dehydrogenase